MYRVPMSSCSLCNSAWTRWFTGMGWKRDVDSLGWHLVVIASVCILWKMRVLFCMNVGRGRIVLAFSKFSLPLYCCIRVLSVVSPLMKLLMLENEIVWFLFFFFFYQICYILYIRFVFPCLLFIYALLKLFLKKGNFYT